MKNYIAERYYLTYKDIYNIVMRDIKSLSEYDYLRISISIALSPVLQLAIKYSQSDIFRKKLKKMMDYYNTNNQLNIYHSVFRSNRLTIMDYIKRDLANINKITYAEAKEKIKNIFDKYYDKNDWQVLLSKNEELYTNEEDDINQDFLNFLDFIFSFYEKGFDFSPLSWVLNKIDRLTGEEKNNLEINFLTALNDSRIMQDKGAVVPNKKYTCVTSLNDRVLDVIWPLKKEDNLFFIEKYFQIAIENININTKSSYLLQAYKYAHDKLLVQDVRYNKVYNSMSSDDENTNITFSKNYVCEILNKEVSTLFNLNYSYLEYMLLVIDDSNLFAILDLIGGDIKVNYGDVLKFFNDKKKYMLNILHQNISHLADKYLVYFVSDDIIENEIIRIVNQNLFNKDISSPCDKDTMVRIYNNNKNKTDPNLKLNYILFIYAIICQFDDLAITLLIDQAFFMDTNIKELLVNDVPDDFFSTDSTITNLLINHASEEFLNKIDEGTLSKLDNDNGNLDELFFIAIKRDHTVLVKKLINDFLSVDYKFEDDLTAIQLAIKSNSINVVKLLFENNVKFNIFNLVEACICADHVMIERLLTLCIININEAYDQNQCTVLMMAAEKGYDKLVALFISYGADINLTDKQGNSALCFACYKNHVEIVDLLLFNGATIDYQNKKGSTALSIASRYNSVDVIYLLIRNYANIKLKNNTGTDCLMIVCSCGYIDAFDVIVNNQVQKVIEQENNDGFTALMIAVIKNNVYMVERLILLNFDVNKKNKKGETALMFASKYGYHRLFVMLLENKADINAVSETGGTIFNLAKDAEFLLFIQDEIYAKNVVEITNNLKI